VLQEMGNARALIFPSLAHENCPLTVLEAFATGLPVLCSRTGNLATLVQDGVTGWLFTPGAADALIDRIRCIARDRTMCRMLGRQARRHWQREFTASANRVRLEEIYATALQRARN
jgi:glycosyltransferase involved in cell wall biosynthesis